MVYKVIRHSHDWIIEVSYRTGGFVGYVADEHDVTQLVKKKGDAFRFLDSQTAASIIPKEGA